MEETGITMITNGGEMQQKDMKTADIDFAKIESNYKKAKEEYDKHVDSFLKKKVIDTFEDVQRFVALYDKPGIDKRPVVVTEELFHLLSGGDPQPLMNYRNLVLVNEKKLSAYENNLPGKRQANTTIIT